MNPQNEPTPDEANRRGPGNRETELVGTNGRDRSSGAGLPRLVQALEANGCEPNAARGVARCPAHDDRRPSLHFKQGQRGALVICRTQRCPTEAIAAALGLTIAALFDDYAPKGSRPRPMLRLAAPAAAPEPEPEPLLEIPESEVWRPGERVTYLKGDGSTCTELASAVHVYRRADGRAHHVVVRIDRGDGKKTFRPLRWDGRVWRAGAQPRPASLYRLELVRVRCRSQIVVVEGEKACDEIAARAIPRILAVTWPGGSGAVERADWSPLAGRDVVLWPDADDAGRAAMTKLAGILAPNVASLKMVRTDDLEKGYDAADVPLEEPMLEWMRRRVVGVRR